MKRLVSGITPTGKLHIGHYFGAIKQFVEMQKEYETFVFVADLHSLTINPDKDELNENIKHIAAAYIAAGLDGDNVNLFIQSENEFHSMTSWALECHAYFGEMSRMTQFKDKSQKNDNFNTGLFTYPALMAADILLYNADVVPVGIDQQQHIELTRTIANRINNKYGETFKVPKGIFAKSGAKIMNLTDPTKKMSKSDENTRGTIFLLDDEKTIRKKIMSAVTDSDALVKYDEDNKEGISNLMTIYSLTSNLSIKEIEERFKNKNYGAFKKEVADSLVEYLKEFKENYDNIINSEKIDEILDEGLKNSRKIAKEKTYELYHKLGIGRY